MKKRRRKSNLLLSFKMKMRMKIVMMLSLRNFMVLAKIVVQEMQRKMKMILKRNRLPRRKEERNLNQKKPLLLKRSKLLLLDLKVKKRCLSQKW
jgi:hypothetical protein